MSDGIDFAGNKVGTDEVTVGSETMHVQRQKLIHGVDGTNDGDVARTNPLPVQSILSTDLLQNGSSQLTPKFAAISLTATGTIVAAVAGKKIRVLALALTFDTLTGDETYIFKSGAGGTALTGALGDASGVGPAVVPFLLPFSPVGWFETVAGELLELALTGTTPFVNGCLVYVEV